MVFILISSAVLETVLPPCTALGQAKPPLLLSVVLYYALARKPSIMFAAAFLGGCLHDALSPIPLGYSAFCFCCVGWIASRFRSLVLTESPVTPIFFGGVCGFGVTLGLYVLLTLGELIRWPVSRVLLKAIGTGILGMICALLIFVLTGSLDRLVGNVGSAEELGGRANGME